MNELKIIDEKEARAVLVDAAATHRNAVTVSPKPDEHRAVASLIEGMIKRGAWMRRSEAVLEKD